MVNILKYESANAKVKIVWDMMRWGFRITLADLYYYFDITKFRLYSHYVCSFSLKIICFRNIFKIVIKWHYLKRVEIVIN